MSRDNGRRSQRRNPIDWLSPDELARANEEARYWRAALRNGKLIDAPQPAALCPIRKPDEAARRARFAEALARAEFGRFYRNGRRDADGRTGRPKTPGDARHKPR